MIIGFYVQCFTYRGTCTALFDYAFYNQTILNNKSIILCNKSALYHIDSKQDVANKFFKSFTCILFDDLQDLNNQLNNRLYNQQLTNQLNNQLNNAQLDNNYNIQKLDIVYCIKYGTIDSHFTFCNSPIFPGVKTVVHCVFKMDKDNKHGDVYAGVSKSVANLLSKDSFDESFKFPYVDHIISLPEIKTNLRKEFNIPENAIVFGRLGGTDTFNIPYTVDVIKSIISRKNNNIYFIFAVLPDILHPLINKENNELNNSRELNKQITKFIISVPSFFDQKRKREFINTCDAMIHASLLGESQGLSILEFSYCNKPVITWNGGQWHKQHLDNLGDYAIKYNNKEELYNILTNFSLIKTKNVQFNNVCKQFTPEIVMKKFESVFIK